MPKVSRAAQEKKTKTKKEGKGKSPWDRPWPKEQYTPHSDPPLPRGRTIPGKANPGGSLWKSESEEVKMIAMAKSIKELEKSGRDKASILWTMRNKGVLAESAAYALAVEDLKAANAEIVAAKAAFHIKRCLHFHLYLLSFPTYAVYAMICAWC
jgi:hypothetical protein